MAKRKFAVMKMGTCTSEDQRYDRKITQTCILEFTWMDKQTGRQHETVIEPTYSQP